MTRTPIGALFAGVLLVMAAYVSAFIFPPGDPATTCLMIAGSALIISAATVLGAANSGVRPAVVKVIAVFLLVDVTAGFGFPALLPADRISDPMVLGLPLRVAIEVYGVGILPIVLLPVLFAIEFRRSDVDAVALAELRRRSRDVPGA